MPRSRKWSLLCGLESISPSVMIPEHRLATLLDQVKQYQIVNCTYHNPSKSPSLFTDHVCDRSQFPLHTLFELRSNPGEVWSLQFSHNGKLLATSGESQTIVMYDMTTYQPKNTLRGHESHVPYLTWSPDDSKLISCSHDYKAKVWDIAVGLDGPLCLRPPLIMVAVRAMYPHD